MRLTFQIPAFAGTLAILHVAIPAQSQAPTPSPTDRLDIVQKKWLQALDDRPPLVSLGTPPDLSGAREHLNDLLKERLLILGKKTFSNRKWSGYWERQQTLATELAGLFDEATSARADPVAVDKAAGLRAWAQLAADKTKNQDTYLKAIGTERDAVEERRQAALDDPSGDGEASEALGREAAFASPNPYQRREQRLAGFQKQIEFHRRRRAISEVELRLIERQAESIELLNDAERNDVELANRELNIALEQAGSVDEAWAAIWKPIAAVSATKAMEIEAELAVGEQRWGDLEVEIELATAQIEYRNEKIQVFEAKHAEARGVETLAFATWETVKDFARQRLWKIAAILLLIYIGLRVALRIINASTAAFLRAVSDKDDAIVSAREKRAETISTVFTPVAKVAIYVITILIAMEQIGIDIAPILGSVAILGLAISFGSQNLVRDLVNGFFILVENQFGVGDYVEISGHSGTIESVNVRSTRMRSLDGTLRIIPNGEITNVANLTRDWSRAICHVGVAYDSDINAVERVVNEVGQKILDDPEWKNKLLEAPSFGGVTELGDSAVVFRAMAKTPPGEQWGVGRELNRRLLAGLTEAGIEIPFPQRVVWHKSEIPAVDR